MSEVFNNLYGVDVSAKVEKKNGLSYLSWAWAWAEVKKRYSEATYTVYENKDGCFYHTDGKTAWVKTGVTIDGLEHIEYLPVMDFRNKSIPIANITSFDVTKAIQRSLTKAIARHGLGLCVYVGEDYPENEEMPQEHQQQPKQQAKMPQGVQQGLKGGNDTPEEHSEINNLLKSTYSNGQFVFTPQECNGIASMRFNKTAQEVIVYLKSEIMKRVSA